MSNDEEVKRKIELLTQTIAEYLFTHHGNDFIDLEMKKGSAQLEAMQTVLILIPLAAIDIAREQITRRTTISAENYYDKAIDYLDRLENPRSMQ